MLRTGDWLRTETGAAMLLVVVVVVALVWANSPLSESYTRLWEIVVRIDAGRLHFDMDLRHWVNDGLMVLFFFVIGLEVRQEFAVGTLRSPSRRRVPLVAGVFGVLVPAAIYLAVAGRTAPEGWGVVIGTDTAFLLGVLALVGPAMSGQLRAFLLTLTVVDDFIAVAVIGTVYSDDIRLVPLAIAVVCLGALWLLGLAREWRSTPYVLVVVALWGATVQAGVHPSLAGMLAGLLVPAATPRRDDVIRAKELFRTYWQSPNAVVARDAGFGLARSISINHRLHEQLRASVSLVVVPVFAFANAGIDLRGGALGEALISPVLWGVVAGLVAGKLLGIGLGTWLVVRGGLGRLPDGVGPGSVLGGAALSGIGFTVSLLIADLAFADPAAMQAATIGVLLSMILSTGLGWLVFRVARVRFGEHTADLPVTLTPEVDVELDHVRGNPGASHTVVEYLDFECPFCARITGMGRDLYEHFGDDVRYVVRHLPLEDRHPRAFDAALASEAAHRQGMFWEMHDLLFAHQSQLEPHHLRQYAAELELDLGRFEADMADETLADRVRRHARSARESGAVGTPTFFLNGARNQGSHDARTLIALLEESLPDGGIRRRS